MSEIDTLTDEQIDSSRRSFLGMGSAEAALATIGAIAASAAAPLGAAAEAQSLNANDTDILNFALNLEYLEAEFYLRAVTGRGLGNNQTDGRGKRGTVTGGRRVRFKSSVIRGYAEEIAEDEKNHVLFLRKALGNAAVAEPSIDLENSFNAAAKAAGLGNKFDPFADDASFLLGAFIFEDVGVTAYKGAAPLIDNKDYLSAAAGILAVEAYHAANIRVNLLALGLQRAAEKISNLRDAADGRGDDDQGIGTPSRPNIVPADGNSIAFSRSAGQVLNIVYLNRKGTPGGFFPNGLNGAIS